MAENLVTLNRVAHDGMRVRASAGAASFRRRPRLERFLAEARAQVETLKQMADESALDSNTPQNPRVFGGFCRKAVRNPVQLAHGLPFRTPT
jgi:hypothetical protein